MQRPSSWSIQSVVCCIWPSRIVLEGLSGKLPHWHASRVQTSAWNNVNIKGKQWAWTLPACLERHPNAAPSNDVISPPWGQSCSIHSELSLI